MPGLNRPESAIAVNSAGFQTKGNSSLFRENRAGRQESCLTLGFRETFGKRRLEGTDPRGERRIVKKESRLKKPKPNEATFCVGEYPMSRPQKKPGTEKSTHLMRRGGRGGPFSV